MNQKGFTLIELLFAIALSALFLPALVFVFSFSLGAASQGESYTQAYTIAQEQMEVIYSLKESWDWETEANPDTYQLEKTSGAWSLVAVGATPIEIGGYTATVEIITVRRDSDGNITEDASEEEDQTTRKIIVEVLWKEKGEDTSIDLVSYVTKH